MADLPEPSETWTEETMTNDLRWGHNKVLQRRWIIKTFVDGRPMNIKSVWRPIPDEEATP